LGEIEPESYEQELKLNKVIKDLERDLHILQCVHTIIKSHVECLILEKVAKSSICGFTSTDKQLYIDTFHEPLTESELEELVNFLGFRYYGIEDAGTTWINYFTNEMEV
jgi:hypothetical protein